MRARFGARIEWLPLGVAADGQNIATRPSQHPFAAPSAPSDAGQDTPGGTAPDAWRAHTIARGPVQTARLRRARDPIATGDWVELSRQTHDWIVERRLPRRNEVRRIDGFGRVKTIAANVDRIWLAFSQSPPPSQFMLERMLAAVYALDAEPVLLWTKTDLATDAIPAATPTSSPEPANAAHDRDAAHDCDAVLARMPDALRQHIHQATLGLRVPILPVSPKYEQGLDAVRALARGATNLLLGGSGVGKTSLLRALIPDVAPDDDDSLRVDTLGQNGEGQHTTTTARLHVVEDPAAKASTCGQTLHSVTDRSKPAALWIDAPGVRDFTPVIDNQLMLAKGFPELAAVAQRCRFRDCRHAAEPGCAVRDAIGHTLSPTRFAVWQQILKTLKDAAP